MSEKEVCYSSQDCTTAGHDHVTHKAFGGVATQRGVWTWSNKLLSYKSRRRAPNVESKVKSGMGRSTKCKIVSCIKRSWNLECGMQYLPPRAFVDILLCFHRRVSRPEGMHQLPEEATELSSQQAPTIE